MQWKEKWNMYNTSHSLFSNPCPLRLIESPASTDTSHCSTNEEVILAPKPGPLLPLVIDLIWAHSHFPLPACNPRPCVDTTEPPRSSDASQA
ncbi:unnamed protein product [Pleuronectes platessa]|uniref:Uncharacterized protein n=1 Tax=Pleuronectes platessa TaxID=8262 RepID=A0A9N7VN12_PLEPL|nr:unnamed protein product [Pleuronectes platessa]